MTADWDEVKRLAADFQKAQLSSTLQKLSERNCIEIVQWLIEHKLIDVIYTSDGKEYITPQYLVQEIRGELFISGGRLNLVELSKNLCVDLTHINNYIPEILKTNRDTHFILGQLIDDAYIIKIANEINDKLLQIGQISVSDLTLQYDLPADFLQHNVIERNLGRIIQGRQDSSNPKVFFTEAFITRSKAMIRGALAGLTKPTSVTAIVGQIGLQEKLFFSLYDEVIKFGSLTSKLPGAHYIPHIYSKTQNEWVTNFYKQNGYLEFDTLVRLGLGDYKNYLKRQLANEELTNLNSCVVSKRILDQVEADLDECINSKSYIDLQNNIPSIFNDEDIRIMLEHLMTPQRKKSLVLFDSIIMSTAFLDSLTESCNEMVQEKGKTFVNSGAYQQYQLELQVGNTKSSLTDTSEDSKVDKREERRRKAAGGKAGGGAQGRETKTKSTKKQVRGSKSHALDSDEEITPLKKNIKTLEIITIDDVKQIIANKLEEEGLDDLIDSVAAHIYPALSEKAKDVASSLYASTISNQAANRRQTHTALQDKINTLLGDVRLFEKGTKLLPPDVQSQLVKYLLKSLCTDIVNDIVNYLSSEYRLGSPNDLLTSEQRTRLVNELPPEHRSVLQNLLKALSGSNIEEFMSAAEESLASCSMILKKIDKKKDRVIVLNHKHSLLDQLEKCEDAALVLHLATLVIFEVCTQNMIHASGRHVNTILSYLKQFLSEVQLNELSDFHDLVTTYLSAGSNSQEIAEKLKEKIPTIKKIAIEFKKPTNTEK